MRIRVFTFALATNTEISKHIFHRLPVLAPFISTHISVSYVDTYQIAAVLYRYREVDICKNTRLQIVEFLLVISCPITLDHVYLGRIV